MPSHYKLHKEWTLSAKDRESLLSRRNQQIIDNYNSQFVHYPHFLVTHVAVQNKDLDGKKLWVKTGKVVEALANRQYRIRMNHSGRVTLQNRKFLKHCLPITPPAPPPTPYVPDDCLAPTKSSKVSQPATQENNTPLIEDVALPEPQVPRVPIPRALKRLAPFNKAGVKGW